MVSDVYNYEVTTQLLTIILLLKHFPMKYVIDTKALTAVIWNDPGDGLNLNGWGK